ncbi:hypothetical protein HKX48_000939 [Thoreauomyces humboldtii]|nr:hypothetical protein HKX48_000939 [Thoreauomyces humboldtii]
MATASSSSSHASFLKTTGIGIGAGVLLVLLLLLGFLLYRRRRQRIRPSKQDMEEDGNGLIVPAEKSQSTVDDDDDYDHRTLRHQPSNESILSSAPPRLLLPVLPSTVSPVPTRPPRAAARTNPVVQSWLARGTSNDGWRDSITDELSYVYPDLVPPAEPPRPDATTSAATTSVVRGWEATGWAEISVQQGWEVVVWTTLADGWSVVLWPGSEEDGSETPQAGVIPTACLSPTTLSQSSHRSSNRIPAPPPIPQTRESFLSHPCHMSGYGDRSSLLTQPAKRDFYIRALASGMLANADRRAWAAELGRCVSSIGPAPVPTSRRRTGFMERIRSDMTDGSAVIAKDQW